MLRTFLALATVCLLSALVTAADTRPNVVVVLSDDLGPGDLSAYGGPTATPHIDRMAKEGTRFTRYYAPAPICSPSRCGMITGQFPGRWRITSYLQTRAGNKACGQADFLDPAAPSLPRALKAAGYKTAHVGKWHLGGGRDVVDAPKFAAYGYDIGLGTYESPEPHPDLTTQDWIWSAADKVKRWDRSGWMVDRTLDFLKADATAPCFVNLWLDDPHTPWVPTDDDQQPGKGGRTVGKGDTPKRLAGVLTEMDRQVGRLLDGVRARKTNRPTVVLFLSDNGPLPTFDRKRTTGLRGSKLSLYEGGIRLPFIAWCPGLVPAGTTNDTTVLAGVDLFPTLCRLCGAKLPDGYEPDGEDLSPALLGKPAARTKPLFWEYGRNDSAFAYPGKKTERSPNVAVRDGNWKLLVNANGTGAELYDVAADPNEATDRSAAEPVVAKRLTDTALKWRKALP
ncbi:sulfatase [Fimbriiglobus ruber]|uniref:Choline-sulfatase n=1 Tax=Fimbriiglobus ruber TaxID=1908690 RepID=A0A225DNS9_9BACT|nr:sulfatase-like hydrolase/transferase [Fimbriiglobus ruber]OWK40238.1 Choline-sulfatase [Fimbriiglobus ruber]